MNVSQRYDFARKHKLCLNCLHNSHFYSACKSKFMCNVCGKKHNTLHKSNEELLSPDRLPPQDELNTESELTMREENSSTQPQNVYSLQTPVQSLSNTTRENSTILLSTAVLLVQNCYVDTFKCRVILDSASQINLISSEFATLLKLKREKNYAPVSGINESVQTVKSRVYGTISNKNESFNAELEFLVIPKITDLTPSVALNISGIQLPQDIQLADAEFFKPGKVDMLLGAKVFFKILKYEKIQIGESIVLQGSVFGFLVTGKLPISQPIKSCFFIKK
ncbi:integrase catalytic domain-containing protein [Trichonephila clavata]|uniref:Integrase catalytic domain-containing protein n=1 Tax=Trichonephila clavata TaxID=2740835 RepID=A0A8X6FSH5_TRICU|nr:integrase catalytic domain-containing protein [Trichonephila clavata]